jgi:3-oxoacyl-[acyl-carrier protein] reductase
MISKPVMIITGTRTGIGKRLLEHYIKQNFYVIGCSRGKVDFEGENYCHFCLDVSDESAIKKMFGVIRKKYNRLDVLINNAGVNHTLSPVLLVPYESARRTIEINLLGTFLMSREAIKIMMKGSCGRIINMGSMAVRHEVKGEAIYTASKAAICSFTRVLAKEVYDIGITCNVISPSAIHTDLTKNIDSGALSEILSRNAIPDFGKTEDIVNTIDWLIRPASDNITGQTIYLGGV